MNPGNQKQNIMDTKWWPHPICANDITLSLVGPIIMTLRMVIYGADRELDRFASSSNMLQHSEELLIVPPSGAHTREA